MPISAMSSGTRSPRARIAPIAPIASSSEWAKIAVGAASLSRSSSVARAAAASPQSTSLVHPGSGSTPTAASASK